MTDSPDYDPFPHALKAGRELDALVAEKVMGWARQESDGIVWLERDMQRAHPDSKMNPLPHYSTDIAAAWEVLSACADKGEQWTLDRLADRYRVHIWEFPQNVPLTRVHEAEANTAPLAICLAALKVVQP